MTMYGIRLQRALAVKKSVYVLKSSEMRSETLTGLPIRIQNLWEFLGHLNFERFPTKGLGANVWFFY